jgi:hypothetical protein
MSNPQQPELARSRKTPAQDQDAVAGVVEGQRVPDSSGPGGPVPADNQPGHHPPEEQDKPDLNAFAAKLGVPDEQGNVPPAPAAAGPTPRPVPAPANRLVAIGAAGLGMVLTVAVIRRRRRRSRSRRGRS